ncbi:GNAT family N-acetyltransferase [Pseudonocardia sp.]|uniref:GNAT family N-acetyltransferase n=1 Tax=Pseudonocardia sp. TaxID=60912 RepID=UPI003D1209B2
MELRRVPFTHPDAVALVAAVQQEYVQRYGGGDGTPVDPAEFAPPRGWFVVGYAGGEPVAAGGFRVRSGAEDAAVCHGDAEIKRMYVADHHRGRGFARAVLAELERVARELGCRRTILETGTRQPEAVALYRSAGYVAIPPFGIYREHPACRCFAKALLVPVRGVTRSA